MKSFYSKSIHICLPAHPNVVEHVPGCELKNVLYSNSTGLCDDDVAGI
jgi:hypothetical protein